VFRSTFLRKQNSIFGLIGAGGFGRELMPIESNFELIGGAGEKIQTDKYIFVDEKFKGTQVNEISVQSESEYLKAPFLYKYFNIAMSDSVTREAIAKRLLLSNISPVSMISNNSYIHESSTVGVGSILCRSSIVTSNSTIGVYFHANIFSYVAHDCIIGDYVTFAPRVSCNGNVVIGDHAYIGTNASIKQGTKTNPIYIGKSSIVGMGAVVTKDVPDFAVVVGNPARIIKYVKEMNPRE